jgi:hypothetical protein
MAPRTRQLSGTTPASRVSQRGYAFFYGYGAWRFTQALGRLSS